MADLGLKQDEGIFLEEESVEFDESVEIGGDLEKLYLTNLNLICELSISQGMFKKSESAIKKYPISSIKIINGVPMVKYGHPNKSDGYLEVAFIEGDVLKIYFGEPKKTIPKWKSAIEKLIAGEDVSEFMDEEIEEDDDESRLACIFREKMTSVSNKVERSLEKRETQRQKRTEESAHSSEDKQITTYENVVDENLCDSVEVRYCTYCGNRIIPTAKFCASCGKAVGMNGDKTFLSNETDEISKAEKKKPEKEDETETKTEIKTETVVVPEIKHFEARRQVFDGEIHKCPNCGEVLNSFIVKCPACGYELRGAKAADSVHELAAKLEQIESKRENYKSTSFVSKIYGDDGQISKTDEQKVSLIRSIVIPNTKEDIYEFMILASSNIDVKVYDLGNSRYATASRKNVSDAWFAKFEQAYEKAKLTFGNTSDFENIQRIYDRTKGKIKKEKLKLPIMFGGFILFLVIVWIFIIVGVTNTTPEQKIKSRESHLNYTVTEIEQDIADGNYSDARNKAYTLTFDSELSQERSEYWEQKEQEILELIDEASQGDDE
jgi:hypothetical protein